MAQAPFKLQQTADTDLQFVQRNIQTALGPLQTIPMAGGNVLGSSTSPIAVGTGVTSIPHKLGRPSQFWSLLGLNANATVWAPQASDSNFIYLQASAACGVIVWVN